MPFKQHNNGNKPVLIADDNPVNRKVVLSMLAKLKLEADIAENGQTALEAMSKATYQLVLMDCRMPGMDGYEATRAFREHERTSGICRTPIIALTAEMTAETHTTCLNAGMDDFLSKPLDFHTLSTVVHKWCCVARPSGTSSAIKQETLHHHPAPANTSKCWNEFAALDFLEGDKELLIELIALFIENAPEQLKILDHAILKHDLDCVANAAHRIKSMISTFHAEPTIALATELENCARHRKSSELEQIADQLSYAVKQLMGSLQAVDKA